MATITAVQTDNTNGNTVTISWLGFGNADTGTAAALSPEQQATIQLSGTFGSATMTVQGSNDGGVTWFTLNDQSGTALLAVASAKLAALQFMPSLVRVITQSGAGGVSLNAYLCYQKAFI